MPSEKEIEEVLEWLDGEDGNTRPKHSFILRDAYLSMKAERDQAINEIGRIGKELGEAQSERGKYKASIPLSIVYQIMLTRWDSIEEGEEEIRRSLGLDGIEVTED